MKRMLKQKRFTILTESLIVVFGISIFAAISLWTIGASSVWFDEAFSAYIIRFNFLEIIQYTAQDVHPPLYYFFLKTWSMVFGTTDVALRSMSVLFGAIAILGSYALVRKLFGKRAALFSLLILILSPVIIRYSQEMRMYTMVAAIAIAATYMLVQATRTQKKRDWVIYGILVALGMYTHYFAAIVWLAHWAWRAWDLSGKRQSFKKFFSVFFSKEWVFAHIVAVGLYVPWLPLLVTQLLVVQAFGFWIPPVSPATIGNFVTSLLFYREQGSVTSWGLVAFVAILALLVYLMITLYRSAKAERQSAYRLLLCVSFVPAIILIIASMPPLQSTFVERYLIPSAFMIAALVGVLLADGSRRYHSKLLSSVVMALIVGSLISGISSVYYFGNYNKTTGEKSAAKQVIQAVKDRSSQGQPIIANSPWAFYDAVFYSTADYPVYFSDKHTEYRYGSLEMLRTKDQFKIDDIEQFTRDHDSVWYIGRVGSSELTPLSNSWKKVQEFRIDDSISMKPAYQAIEYQFSAE